MGAVWVRNRTVDVISVPQAFTNKTTTTSSNVTRSYKLCLEHLPGATMSDCNSAHCQNSPSHDSGPLAIFPLHRAPSSDGMPGDYEFYGIFNVETLGTSACEFIASRSDADIKTVKAEIQSFLTVAINDCVATGNEINKPFLTKACWFCIRMWRATPEWEQRDGIAMGKSLIASACYHRSRIQSTLFVSWGHQLGCCNPAKT
jgi:hypothetical protein